MIMMLKLSLVTFLLLIFSALPTQSAVDYTQLGVSAGDPFTFHLEEYSRTENGSSTDEYLLGVDQLTGESGKINAGDTFKMLIGSDELRFETVDNIIRAYINVIFESSSVNVVTEERLGGDFISSIDWIGVQDHLTSDFNKLWGESEGYNLTFNDEGDFGYQLKYTNLASSFNVSTESEIYYNRGTGVMKNFESKSNSVSTGYEPTDLFSETIKISFIPEEGSEGFDLPIPGFQVLIMLVFMFTFGYFKRRY